MPELQGAVSDRIKMRIAILLFVVLFLSCSQKIEQTQNTEQPQQKPKIIIPQRRGDYSLEKAVDLCAKAGGLQSLREISLPNGDFEIRFWIFNRFGINGLIIRKSGENWSALFVERMPFKNDNLYPENRYINPKSDWQNILQRINEAEIFTLPDSSEVKNYEGDKVNDGFSNIVEINKDGIYRVYEYVNPNWAENPEAKQIVKIGNIIADEFGLEEFRVEIK
ncbi:MAG: hypothetical protein ABJA66_03035 [Actinomycetota bacterium]